MSKLSAPGHPEIAVVGDMMSLDRLPGVVAEVVMGMRHGRTGDMRWLRVTAVPDARDERGRPQRAYAMLVDITEQRQAEAARRRAS